MLTDRAVSLLACVKCRGAVAASPDGVRCTACGVVMPVTDGVVLGRTLQARSYFDDIYEVMRTSNSEAGTWDIFYKQQVDFVSANLGAGEVVLDVGCGPDIAYKKGGAYIVGLDASFESIRANRVADLRLFASAATLPLRDASVDVIVCFYSVHHMTGETVAENRRTVTQVFHEFRRALKPSGRLMVFDVSPRWPFGPIENWVWDSARRKLGSGLDMFFWQGRDLAALGGRVFPSAQLKVNEFVSSAFTTFPPVFSKQWLRLPRALYPFAVNLYEWRMPATA